MARLFGRELEDAVKVYKEMFEDLKQCFVGRDEIIDKLLYAILQRQHMLIFGSPGTSKTAIGDMLFKGITNAQTFCIELSMFMSEDALFGPYDPKVMREQGVLTHRVEGMLPEADFARLGEFLDANMPLLRSTLSSLNERRLVRGRQVVDMPLVTVYCDTNVDPGLYLQSHPNSWAVIDRLLFICHVDYLKEDEEIEEMLSRFQSGKTGRLNKTVSLDLIHRLSELIISPPSLINNSIIYARLAHALNAYRQCRKDLMRSESNLILPTISDRRLCLATQMAETEAVLNGRLEVVPSDILPLHHVLCTTSKERELWEKLARQAIKEIEEESVAQLNHAQTIAIDGIVEAANQLIGHIVNMEDLREAGGQLHVLCAQLNKIAPENDIIQGKLEQAARKVTDIQDHLKQMAVDMAGLGSVPDQADHNPKKKLN